MRKHWGKSWLQGERDGKRQGSVSKNLLWFSCERMGEVGGTGLGLSSSDSFSSGLWGTGIVLVVWGPCGVQGR